MKPESVAPSTVTLEDLQKAFPKRKATITQEAVDIINQSRNDAEFQGESLLHSAVTYEAVLQRNKASIAEYIRALKFCAFLATMEDNYTEAYKRTFFDRKFVQERMGLSSSDPKYAELASAASRYRRSKLVVDILTLSQVPLDMMFTGYRYKAVAVLAELMTSAKYDRDKINAAKELLAATKGADNLKIDIGVEMKESSAVQQLNEQLAQLAMQQKAYLESGRLSLAQAGAMSPREEAIDVEVEDE